MCHFLMVVIIVPVHMVTANVLTHACVPREVLVLKLTWIGCAMLGKHVSLTNKTLVLGFPAIYGWE